MLAFAAYRAQYYFWRGGVSTLALGNTLEDIVQTVILKTIEGRRKWNPDEGELLPWLKMQIMSELDALAKSAPHRREILSLPENNQETVQDKREYNARKEVEHDQTQQREPELVVIEKDEICQKEKEAQDKIGLLIDSVSEEPELEEVLNAIIDGCDPRPRFLAEELGIPVEEIYNRNKRLRRRALAILKDFQNEKAKTA